MSTASTNSVSKTYLIYFNKIGIFIRPKKKVEEVTFDFNHKEVIKYKERGLNL